MTTTIPTEIIALIIGAFLLLFGYRLKKIAITLIWFLVGFWIVSLFVDKIVADQMWQLILCCVGGLILGMFGMTIEKFAVFVTVGVTFCMSVIENFGPATDWTLWAIAVAVGVVAGVIAVWLIKPMVILATVVEGSRLIIINALALLGWAQPPYYIVIFLALAAVGAIFQWNNCRHIE